MEILDSVLESLTEQKNLLIYGPPGTGKTYLLSQIISNLSKTKDVTPVIIPGESEVFGLAEGGNWKAQIPSNIEVEWVTFHQYYSYDDFILGKRPRPKDGGMFLEPYLGILTDGALRVAIGESEAYLLIIDEINRANTSQVFGEFITFMEPGYRATIDGKDNSNALPVRFPGVIYNDDRSEPLLSLRNGNRYQLPYNWKFPENVFVVATMNSVDRAALPLDSALTRRFYRIELRCDLKVLAENLGLTEEPSRDTASMDSIGYKECAYFLLERLNTIICAEIGSDFELGHFLLKDLFSASSDEDGWHLLIDAWDHKLFPQIMDRFTGRNEVLKDIFKVSQGSVTELVFNEIHYASAEGVESGSYIKTNRLKDVETDGAINVLKQMSL